MQRTLILVGLICALQAVVSAACSTPSTDVDPSVEGGAGGIGGESGAVGGAPGTAGTDESGGSGGSLPEPFPRIGGLPKNLAWLDDPEIWSLLPEPEVWDESCYVREAASDLIQFPPLEWEPCGDGCARAEVLQGHGDVAGDPAISLTVDGRPYFHVIQAGIFTWNKSITLHRIIDLSSGLTVGAVQSVVGTDKDDVAWCPGARFENSGFVASIGRVRPERAPSLRIKGTWNRSNKAWIWQQPWVSLDFIRTYCNMVGMEDGGRSFYLCGGVVRAAITPGSSDLIDLAVPGDEAHSVRGGGSLGNVIVWSEIAHAAEGSRVRMWTPDGKGVRTILGDIPADTCTVGINATHVVGFSRSNACDSYQPNGRFWLAERGEDGSLQNLELGPVFWPRPVSADRKLATWGAHIALVWYEQYYEGLADRQRLILARTTDWAMRDLRGIDGKEIWEAGVTDEHLYVVYTDTGARVGFFSEIYRYDLDKFESLGQAVVPVPEDN